MGIVQPQVVKKPQFPTLGRPPGWWVAAFVHTSKAVAQRSNGISPVAVSRSLSKGEGSCARRHKTLGSAPSPRQWKPGAACEAKQPDLQGAYGRFASEK